MAMISREARKHKSTLCHKYFFLPLSILQVLAFGKGRVLHKEIHNWILVLGYLPCGPLPYF